MGYNLELGKGYATGCRAESGTKKQTANVDCRARNGRKCLFNTNLTIGEVEQNQCIFSAQNVNRVQIRYECLTFPTSKTIEMCCASYPDDCENLKQVYNDIVSTTEDPTAADFLKVLSKCGENTNFFDATCSNDCPGVDASDIVAGGAAVFAATSLAAVTSFIPPLLPGLLGVAGLGAAAMISQQQCIGPLYCTSPSGQCCLLVISNRGLQCPSRC